MKNKDALIQWSDRLILGIPLVDKQHERLVQLANDLHAACLEGRESANSYFIEAAREAVKYVGYHFTTEEKMMLLLEYPDYASHKKEHEQFTKEVLIQTQKFDEQKSLAANRFVHFLKDWILSHVSICDRTMAEYILNLRDTNKLQELFPAFKDTAD